MHSPPERERPRIQVLLRRIGVLLPGLTVKVIATLLTAFFGVPSTRPSASRS